MTLRSATLDPQGQNPSIAKGQFDLGHFQDHFFKKLEGMGRSLNTLKNYRTDLECFNQYLKNNQKGLDITTFNIPHVVEYGNYLQNRYNSDNSRRRRVQALRIFFDYLVEKKIFPTNPVRKLETSPKFLDIPRPTPLIDVKTLWVYLLEEAQSSSKMTELLARRNQVSMLLIFGAGLKVSDLAGLKTNQVFAGNKPRVMVPHAKKDPYTIPLPEVFTVVYQKYMDLLENVKKDSGLTFDTVLFNANPYRVLAGGLSPRGLEIVFEDLRKVLLLKLTPKSLRQACVFKWLQQGIKDSQIKEWMGVAPSYSLKLYKDHLDQNVFNEEFLTQLFNHYEKKSYRKN